MNHKTFNLTPIRRLRLYIEMRNIIQNNIDNLRYDDEYGHEGLCSASLIAIDLLFPDYVGLINIDLCSNPQTHIEIIDLVFKVNSHSISDLHTSDYWFNEDRNGDIERVKVMDKAIDIVRELIKKE